MVGTSRCDVPARAERAERAWYDARTRLLRRWQRHLPGTRRWTAQRTVPTIGVTKGRSSGLFPVIEVRQLTKLFRDRKLGAVRAVDAVQFQCEPGQIYGLLGANGAGKTTTLRMLATLLKPSSGTASVAGHDIVRDPNCVRARIGFISSGTALYARLTARETAEYFGRLHGVGEDVLQQRIRELFSTLDMDEFEDRRCDKLSSGMKQKVSIVRTLIHDPPVMIFDEPTLGLDVMTARTIVQFIRDCRQKGKTVILSTHVMSEAEKLCDRIGIIDHGSLRAEGTLEQLRAQFQATDLEDVFVRAVEAVP